MKYFNFPELTASATAERLAIDNTPPRAAQQMLTVLVEQLLDPIRRRYGAPIIVTSGYRCPALNTAVGGVANSHHIVGCAADIVGRKTPSNLPLYGEALQASLQNISGEHPEGAPHRGGAVQRTEGVCRGGSPNFALFHLIIQMQREGAIQFTQLIAEEGYRWLHISYVPGMLRNQVINVNDDVNVDDNCLPDGWLTSSLEKELTLSLEEKSSLKEPPALEVGYQDSG